MRGRAALVAGLALRAGVALADPQQEAGEHFTRGEQAQQAARYRDAIDEYGEAFRLVPHPNALFNIAVCYEKLGEWANAADYYQRYLSFGDQAPPDADAIKDKVAALRAKSGPGPITPGDPGSSATTDASAGPGGSNRGIVDRVTPGTGTQFSRWHAGVSYGVGVGDTAVERYLARAGVAFANRIDLDGVFGRFGKNDLALGATARLRLTTGPVSPFLHGAVTIGYAKQDHSSSAGTKLPLGLEAGGGVRFGPHARAELTAVLRFIQGGWTADTTVVDSYVNDTLAFAIDLGFAFDIPSSIDLNAR